MISMLSILYNKLFYTFIVISGHLLFDLIRLKKYLLHIYNSYFSIDFRKLEIYSII